MDRIGRRSTFRLLAGSALAGLAVTHVAHAATQSVTVGVDLSLTGADAETANLIKNGFLLAIDEANAKGGPAGIHVNVLMLDDGTATAGQYDPAQGATNARKMVADSTCVAALGPMSSTPGKAMAAIFSQGDLATITPTSTNPDITDPKFAGLYRPQGKAIYFRTVTTDAFQGPNLANYFADVLKVKTMYGLDDSGAYGIGLSAAFEKQAQKKGITLMGHDRLDPKASDYTAALTKIKGLNPQLLYYGGDAQAGVKVVKQGYDIIPGVIKAGGDGMYGPSILTGAGFPACNGRFQAEAVRGEIRREIRHAAVGLLHHRLRRGADRAGRHRAGGEEGQHGDALGRARRDPVDQAGYVARCGVVRRQRRPDQQDRQHLPGAAQPCVPGRRHRASVQVYRGGAAGRRVI
jgi:branched-chain amino acid transport system substrate-binding protein